VSRANARFLIYRHKYDKTKPTVSAFIDTIKWVKISEDKITKQSGNLARYFDKWNCIWITFDVLLLVLYYVYCLCCIQKKIEVTSGEHTVVAFLQNIIMLRCLNLHITAVTEWYKTVLHSRIVATSIPEYVSGWCEHGFWFFFVYLSRYLDQEQRSDLFGLRVKLPLITTSLTTQG